MRLLCIPKWRVHLHVTKMVRVLHLSMPLQYTCPAVCPSSLKSEVSCSLSPSRSATVTSSNLNVRCVGCLSCWPWCHGFVMGYTTCCTHKGWNLDGIHVVLGVCADQLPIYTLIQRWFSHSNFHMWTLTEPDGMGDDWRPGECAWSSVVKLI